MTRAQEPHRTNSKGLSFLVDQYIDGRAYGAIHPAWHKHITTKNGCKREADLEAIAVLSMMLGSGTDINTLNPTIDCKQAWSVNQLSETLNISISDVQRAIEKLEALELASIINQEVEHSMHGDKPTVYVTPIVQNIMALERGSKAELDKSNFTIGRSM